MRNERLAQRNYEIFTRHLAGETQTVLAREFGISQGRVWTICQHYRRLKAGRDAWPEIIRANRNVALNAKFQRLAVQVAMLERMHQWLNADPANDTGGKG